ncbi:MAG: PQQ-dependent sugar dehydrogenase [Myxococcota bacterium]
MRRHALAFALLLAACGGGGDGGEVKSDALDALDAADIEDAAEPADLPADAADIEDAAEPADLPADATDALPDTAEDVTDVSETIDPDVAPDVGPDVDQDVPLPPFTYSATCALPEDDPAPDLELVEAFPDLPEGAIQQPLGLTWADDGTDRLFVNERPGRIRVFRNQPDASEVGTFLDLSDVVYTGGEGGLLSVAFHPDYAENGYFFVNYTTRADGQTTTVVSRFTASQEDPDQADPASEHVLLTVDQPYDNHNGGQLAFGPDGYLYIGLGDGGGGGDPLGAGQDITTLLGSLLRIDVDVPDAQGYDIPADNPFAATDGPERDEIFAWGLRNPWRFSFDTLTGALWLADVGQNAIEELNVVDNGGNYGWNVMEGSACYPPGGPQDCDKSPFELPVAEYGHDVGQSITGGYVYRGSKVPSLFGAYVYADYVTEVLFTWHSGEEPPPEQPLMSTPGRIAGFGQDPAGEVYLLGLFDGRIWRFQETDGGGSAPDFPQTLSETGCFDDVEALDPADGVLPFTVHVPLWADTAGKDRFLVLPEGERLTYDAPGKWGVPDGTLLIKHFAIDTTAGDPSTRTRLETRFLVKEADGVRGYTYRWNEEGTEATLLEGADERDLTLTLPGGETTDYTWRFPSRQQCNSCHTAATGGVLGLETGQINGAFDYGGGAVWNQIDALEARDLLEGAPAGPPEDLLRFPPVEDDSAPAGDRARAWLHANCANCHLPGGAAGSPMDLRHHLDLGEMNACDVPPGQGDLGISDARILAPGEADRSVLHARLLADPPFRMPPISTSLRHDEAIALVEEWIDGLDGCE